MADMRSPQLQQPNDSYVRVQDDGSTTATGPDDSTLLSRSLEPSANGSAVLGVFLALAFVLVGYVENLNSLLSLRSFQRSYCALDRVAQSSSDVATCVDDRSYRLAYLAGSVIGPLLGGFAVADRLGRRWTVLIGALVVVVGGLWTTVNPREGDLFALQVVARGVLGVGASLLSFAALLLWVEVAPARSRGAFGGYLLFALYTGMAGWSLLKLSQSASVLRDNWWTLVAIAVVLAATVALGVLCVGVESLRWRQTIERCRHAPVARALSDASTLQRIAIAFALLTAEQLFRLVNLVQASDILQDISDSIADTDIEAMTLAKMLARGFDTNGLYIAFFGAVPALVYVCVSDCIGRRRLLLFGAVVVGICQLYAAQSLDASCTGAVFQRKCRRGAHYYEFMSLGAIVSYSFTWGPVARIYVFERFPTDVRARAVGLATALSTACALSLKEFGSELSFSVPVLVALPVLALAVVWFGCPETKRLALEDAAALRGRGRVA